MTVTLVDSKGRPPTIRRGTSPTFVFNIAEEEGSIVPKNLTGATEATFAIAKHRSPAELYLQLTLAAGVTHNNDGGQVRVSFTAAQTETLPDGNRWCELWITDVNGVRDLIGEGICPVIDTLVTVP